MVDGLGDLYYKYYQILQKLMDFEYEITYNNPIPEVVCLFVHLVGAVFVCWHVFQYRYQYPYRQNSPYLTISSQLFLFLASVTLFCSKAIVLPDLKANFVHQCLDQKPAQMILLNLVYTFSMEFIMFGCLIRLIRVILIYKIPLKVGGCSKFLIKIFKHQGILFVMCSIWGAFIVAIDFLMKNYLRNKNNPIGLSPQFDVFMCDKPVQQQYFITIHSIYMAKLTVYSVLFAITFIMAGKIQYINKQLSFRYQFFIILFLKFSVIFTDRFLLLFNGQSNYIFILPVHYIDCISNLLCGFSFMYLYVGDGYHKKFYLPTNSHIQLRMLTHLLKHKKSRFSLYKYFEQQNKLDLLKIYERMMGIDLFTLNIEEEEQKALSQVMQNSLGSVNRQQKAFVENIMKEYPGQYKNQIIKLHARLERICEKTNKEWINTKSFEYIENQWAKNKVFQRNMILINLMDPLSDFQQSNSSDFIYS